MKKRGLSPVIASLLIVVITIAAVLLIWAFIQKKVVSSSSDINNSFENLIKKIFSENNNSGTTGGGSSGGGSSGGGSGNEESLNLYLSTPNCSEVINTYLGNGTEENPYQVSNLYQLQCIKEKNLSATYSLTNNIDASPTQNWNLNKDPEEIGKTVGFEPIGTYYGGDFKFKGNFYGQNYVISNIYLHTGDNNAGLFGNTKGSKIQDVILLNVNITGRPQVGGLVGFAENSQILNSFVSGNIKSDYSNVGGIVGLNYLGEIRNSRSEANVYGGSETGGLCGNNNRGTINDSYSTGDVIGGWYVGGLVGDNTGTITNSYSTGNVVGNNYVGGLVGENSWLVLTSFWDINTSNQSSSFGGIGKTTEEMKNISTYGQKEATQNGIVYVISYFVMWSSGDYFETDWEGMINIDGNSYKIKKVFSKTNLDLESPISLSNLVEYSYGDQDSWDFTDVWAIDENKEINQGYPYLKTFN